MPHEPVINLDSTQSPAVTMNTKIVSVRWDLLPWCTVLDCDSPLQDEIEDPLLRRVWLVFVGVDAITCPLVTTRIANGIFCTSSMNCSESEDGFSDFEIPVLLATFKGNDMIGNPHGKINIRAKQMVALASTESDRFGELGPDRLQRSLLASDEDFLLALDGLRRVKGGYHGVVSTP